MSYRPACKAPCDACPFRRASLAGWLGSAKPEGFIVDISMERPLPCHKSIDYDRPTWKREWDAQAIGNICAGSLIMAANMLKKFRDPSYPTLPADKKLVFATPTEFIEHHNAAKIRSWELGIDAEREARNREPGDYTKRVKGKRK